MTKQEKIELGTKIQEARESIPVPPPGREIALVKTKLDEAYMWLLADIEELLE